MAVLNKRKLTPSEKRRKKERKAAFMTVFVNGRQKRVRRPPTIDSMSVDEFIARNADPVWLHENEMWELLPLADDAVNDDVPSAHPRAPTLNPLFSDTEEINDAPQSQGEDFDGKESDEIPF